MQAMTAPTVFKSPEGRSRILGMYDQALAGADVETRTVSTRHGETFVISRGRKDAPPVVLIHGASSNALAWGADMPILSTDFCVHAVDVPGEPGRSAEHRLSFQGLGFAEWLEDVLDKLDVSSPALVGLSQGGWIATRFATVNPARVRALVLLAPGGIVPTRPSFLARAILLTLLGAPGTRRLNRVVLGGQKVHASVTEFMDTIMEHVNPRMDREYIFSDEELSALSMPVLMVAGDRDVIVPAARVAARLAQFAPHSVSRVVPGMGHAVIGVSAWIAEFIGRAYGA